MYSESYTVSPLMNYVSYMYSSHQIDIVAKLYNNVYLSGFNRGFIKDLALGKFTGCDNNFATWFVCLDECFFFKYLYNQ